MITMVKKYAILGLHGINPQTKVKLKLLSLALDKPMTDIVEEMTEKLWGERKDTLTSLVPLGKINKEVRKVLELLR